MDEGLRATFLDAASIACDLVKPACVADWKVYALTRPEQTARRIAECELVFTNKVRIGEEELAAAGRLRLIVVTATGYDIIDLEACRQRQVAVANSPGYSASSVPEHAVALMFAVARSVVPFHGRVRDGTWSKSHVFCLHDHPVIELRGKLVGLIGSGDLGRATGKLCAALGMKVVYCASHASQGDDLPRLPLAELLAAADIVSLHCPLDAANANLINAERIALMKDGAIIINTARGGLVDAPALVDALASGKLAGAGIDVLDHEPPPNDHPLVACEHPGLVVTPHVAWGSREAQSRLAGMAAATADAFFAGRPRHLVT